MPPGSSFETAGYILCPGDAQQGSLKAAIALKADVPARFNGIGMPRTLGLYPRISPTPPTAEVAEPQPAAAPQPEAVAPARPARAAAIAPTAPPPLPSLPSRSTAVNPALPLRTGAAQLQHQPAKSIDASLDALVRERVITPSERVRVRGGMVIPQKAASRQSCSSGALTEQECSLGVVFRGRGRLDGGREAGR